MAQAPILSKGASISVLTCGPGPSLYEAFGHSAIRVADSLNGIDLVFNYGVFDFNQPNFYGNFAKGYMRYMLGLNPTEEFLFQYKYYKRSVREQVLNLDSIQKQAIINYLTINLKQENREYYYAYFDNNCSTKIIELLDSALQHQVIWEQVKTDGKASYRSMIHQYTVFQPWGRLGIDLGLGALIDKPIVGGQFDFLPDFVEKDLARAKIGNEVTGLPLVSTSRTLYESDYFFADAPRWMQPSFIFSILLLISIGLSFLKSAVRLKNVWTGFLFLIAGILGCVLTAIWFFTNHVYAAWNYNLIWANPLFLLVPFYIIWKPQNVNGIFAGIRFYLAAGLLLWFLMPQELNLNLLPFVGALFFSVWKRKTSVVEVLESPM